MRSGSVAGRSPSSGRVAGPLVAAPGQFVERCPRRSRIREAHIPAQHPPSSPQARLSRPHAHPCRSVDHQGQAAQGPHPAVGLIWSDPRTPGVPDAGTLRSHGQNRDPVVHLSQRSRGGSAARRLRGRPLGRSGDATQPAAPPAPCDRRRRCSPSSGCDHGWLLIGATPAASKHTFAITAQRGWHALLSAGHRQSPRSAPTSLGRAADRLVPGRPRRSPVAVPVHARRARRTPARRTSSTDAGGAAG